jgi:DNA-binding HxlR family transcriptional regulator
MRTGSSTSELPMLAVAEHNPAMPTGDEYCHFTKAVENIGDRWSLMIVGELERRGPLGFNGLVGVLPGISRSVLAERLRKLEQLGLVTREGRPTGGVPRYCVTVAGAELRPVFMALKSWALRWVPEDPAVADRDPDLIVAWLKHRIDSAALPTHPVVVDLDVRGTRSKRFWLLLEHGHDPELCNEDPRLPEERYVYVRADAPGLYPVARNARSWSAAIGDGAVEVYGNPELARALPRWFRTDDVMPRALSRAAVA